MGGSSGAGYFSSGQRIHCIQTPFPCQKRHLHSAYPPPNQQATERKYSGHRTSLLSAENNLHHRMQLQQLRLKRRNRPAALQSQSNIKMLTAALNRHTRNPKTPNPHHTAHIYTHTHKHTHTYTYLHTHTLTHTLTHTHTHLHTQTHTHIHTHTHTHVHTRSEELV